MEYFIVMLNYPARYVDGVRISCAGQEAIVDPQITRREVIDRIRSGEYSSDEIAFIHCVRFPAVEDVTAELMEAAGIPEVEIEAIDHQAARFDHQRDLRKNWEPV